MDFDLIHVVKAYFCLLFSLSVHEAAHAAMANRCGDPTARLLGRMTLNPVKHADPIGTVVMPLLMMTTGIPFLFGWAKPVPFNPRNLKDIRRDPVWIALAGPGSNLCIALTTIAVMRVFAVLAPVFPWPTMLVNILQVLIMLAGINFLLMCFNLIPIPPLDGHHVLGYFLPARYQKTFEQIGPFGIIIVIFIAGPVLRIPMTLLFNFLFWAAFSGTELQGFYDF